MASTTSTTTATTSTTTTATSSATARTARLRRAAAQKRTYVESSDDDDDDDDDDDAAQRQQQQRGRNKASAIKRKRGGGDDDDYDDHDDDDYDDDHDDDGFITVTTKRSKKSIKTTATRATTTSSAPADSTPAMMSAQPVRRAAVQRSTKVIYVGTADNIARIVASALPTGACSLTCAHSRNSPRHAGLVVLVSRDHDFLTHAVCYGNDATDERVLCVSDVDQHGVIRGRWVRDEIAKLRELAGVASHEAVRCALRATVAVFGVCDETVRVARKKASQKVLFTAVRTARRVSGSHCVQLARRLASARAGWDADVFVYTFMSSYVADDELRVLAQSCALRTHRALVRDARLFVDALSAEGERIDVGALQQSATDISTSAVHWFVAQLSPEQRESYRRLAARESAQPQRKQSACMLAYVMCARVSHVCVQRALMCPHLRCWASSSAPMPVRCCGRASCDAVCARSDNARAHSCG